ncbi:MAG: hypothetical protein Q9228_002784 [Teloschistes exilis]
MPHDGPNESFPSLDVTPSRRFARAQPTQAHEEAHPNDLPLSRREVYVSPHRRTPSQVTSHPSESNTQSQVISEPSGPRTPPGPRSTRIPEWRTRSRGRSGAIGHHHLDTFMGPRLLPPPGYIPPWRAEWPSNMGDYQGSGPFQAVNTLPDQERRRGDSSPPAHCWPFFSDDMPDSDSHDPQSDSSEDTLVSQDSRASVEPFVSRPIDLLNRPGPIPIPEAMPPLPNPPRKDAAQDVSLATVGHLGEIASSSSTPRPSSYPRQSQRSTGSYDPRNDPMNPHALASPHTSTQPNGGEEKKKNHAVPENIPTAAHHQTKTTTRANLNEAGYAQSQGSAWTPINKASSSSSASPPASPRPSFAKLTGPTPSGDPPNRSVSAPLSPRRTRSRIPSPCINRVLHGRIHGPRLSIQTPGMMPVKPYIRPPPDYEDWHPTTIVIEYQLRRGLGFGEPVYRLCNLLNKGQAYKKHKKIVQGIESRVAWLLRYDDELIIKRLHRYEDERVKWRREALEKGSDVLSEDESPDEEAQSKKDEGKKQVRFRELLEEDAELPDAPNPEELEEAITDAMEDDDGAIDKVMQDQQQDEDDSPSTSSEGSTVKDESPAANEGSSSTVAAEGAVARARDDAVEETELGWGYVFRAFRAAGCHLG